MKGWLSELLDVALFMAVFVALTVAVIALASFAGEVLA